MKRLINLVPRSEQHGPVYNSFTKWICFYDYTPSKRTTQQRKSAFLTVAQLMEIS